MILFDEVTADSIQMRNAIQLSPLPSRPLVNQSNVVHSARLLTGRLQLSLGEESFEDRKSTRLNSSHGDESRMPSSA